MSELVVGNVGPLSPVKHDQAAELRAFASQQGIKQPVEVDKAKLWDDFKALLSIEDERRRLPQEVSNELIGWVIDPEDDEDIECLAEHFYFLGIKHTLAEMHSAETFARVRVEFKGGES